MRRGNVLEKILKISRNLGSQGKVSVIIATWRPLIHQSRKLEAVQKWTSDFFQNELELIRLIRLSHIAMVT